MSPAAGWARLLCRSPLDEETRTKLVQPATAVDMRPLAPWQQLQLQSSGRGPVSRVEAGGARVWYTVSMVAERPRGCMSYNMDGPHLEQRRRRVLDTYQLADAQGEVSVKHKDR